MKIFFTNFMLFLVLFGLSIDQIVRADFASDSHQLNISICINIRYILRMSMQWLKPKVLIFGAMDMMIAAHSSKYKCCISSE